MRRAQMLSILELRLSTLESLDRVDRVDSAKTSCGETASTMSTRPAFRELFAPAAVAACVVVADLALETLGLSSSVRALWVGGVAAAAAIVAKRILDTDQDR